MRATYIVNKADYRPSKNCSSSYHIEIITYDFVHVCPSPLFTKKVEVD